MVHIIMWSSLQKFTFKLNWIVTVFNHLKLLPLLNTFIINLHMIRINTGIHFLRSVTQRNFTKPETGNIQGYHIPYPLWDPHFSHIFPLLKPNIVDVLSISHGTSKRHFDTKISLGKHSNTTKRIFQSLVFRVSFVLKTFISRTQSLRVQELCIARYK